MTREIFVGVVLMWVLLEGAKGAMRMWSKKATSFGGPLASWTGEATKQVLGT